FSNTGSNMTDPSRGSPVGVSPLLLTNVSSLTSPLLSNCHAPGRLFPKETGPAATRGFPVVPARGPRCGTTSRKHRASGGANPPRRGGKKGGTRGRSHEGRGREGPFRTPGGGLAPAGRI